MPEDWSSAGRVPLVAEAIGKLKERHGDDVAVGSWVLGPFTLSGQSMDLDEALKTTLKEPERAAELLEKFTEALIEESRSTSTLVRTTWSCARWARHRMCYRLARSRG